MKRTERLAGAVERFACGSGGRVEVSKCRAVLGTAFAGGRGEHGGQFAAGLRKRSGAECNARPDRINYLMMEFFSLSNEFLKSLFSCVISKMSLIANFPRNPSLFPV